MTLSDVEVTILEERDVREREAMIVLVVFPFISREFRWSSLLIENVLIRNT